MKRSLIDAVGPGPAFWRFGYLIALAIILMPLSDIMGWIILALMTPVIARATYDYFLHRGLPLP